MRRLFLLGGVIVMVASSAAVALSVGLADAAVCTKTWANPGTSGLWNDPSITPDSLETQWSPTGVPSFTDSVCLPAGDYTVTMLHSVDITNIVVGDDTGADQPTLVIGGENPSDNTQLKISDSAGGDNYGTIQLGTDAFATTATLSMNPGQLRNHGLIDLIAGGGGPRLLNGNPNGTFLNTDTGTIHSSSSQGMWGCTTVESSGTIVVDAGASLDWGNCGQVHIDITGGNVTNDGLLVAPSSLDVSGDAVIGGLNPMRVSSGPISFADDPAANIQAWDSTIAGNIPEGINLFIDHPTADFGGTLTATGPTTNEGTINLTSVGNSGGSTLAMPNTTFTNNGIVNLLAGDGGSRLLHGNPNGVFENNGMVASESPGGTWGCLVFNNNALGALDIDPGDTFVPQGCANTNLNLLGGTVLNEGTLRASTSLTVGGAAIIQDTLISNPVQMEGTLTFNPGSTATGDIRVISSASLAAGSVIPDDVEITLDHPSADFGASLGLAGSATNNGTIRLTSEGNSGGSHLSFANSTLTNNGTIALEPGDGGNRTIDGNPNGVLANHGTLRSSTATGFWGCMTLANNDGGTIDIDPASTLTWGNCGQTNLALNGGSTLVNDGLLDVNTLLTVNGDASITGAELPRLTSGTLEFGAGSTATGSVQVTTTAGLASGTTIPAGIVVRVDNPIDGNGAQLGLNGPATNNGVIEVTSAGNSGTSSLNLGLQTLTNNGSIRLLAGGGGTRALQGGSLVNNGMFLIASGSAVNGCNTTTNHADGVIHVVSGATMNITCGGQTYNVEDGEVVVDGMLSGTVNVHGGSLTGVGTVFTDLVTNDGGTVAPGNSPGALGIWGNYTQSGDGVLEIEINGSSSGTGFDHFMVAGTASLGGTIRVLPTVVPTFDPEVLTAGLITGAFDDVDQVPPSWVTHDSAGVVISPTATFPDVPLTHPFFLDIEWAAAEDIVNGFSDGTFKPARTATRQALVAMLYRMSGSPDGADPTCTVAPFPDVPITSDFCGEILWAAEGEIVNGFSDGTFRPGNVVTRQALMAIIYRMAGSPDGATPVCTAAPFPDVPTTHPFCGEISWAKDEGLATGFPGGDFRPGNNVTRQALAAFLHRSVDFIA